MKKIHPKWYPDAKVTCACGNTFTTGATFPEMKVEVCYNCHPHYTGQVKFLDSEGRVDAFKAKVEAANTKRMSKNEKRKLKRAKKIQEELNKPDTLTELRNQI